MGIMTGILLGIQYIHKKGIIHLDLKPQNILIDEKGNPKISDFGIAKTLERANKRTRTIVGTFLYMSLETLQGKKYYTNTDIWSLGCIIYELCCFKV